MGRIDRQHLPDTDATLRQEIDEAIGIRAEISVAGSPRQRSRMQENAGPAPVEDAMRLGHCSPETENTGLLSCVERTAPRVTGDSTPVVGLVGVASTVALGSTKAQPIAGPRGPGIEFLPAK